MSTLVLSVAAVLATGCANAKGAGDKDDKSKSPDESEEDSRTAQAPGDPNLRSLSVDTLRCSMKGQRADQQDLNHDGRADLVSIYTASGAALSCRQADFNFDGRLDAYFHYDEKGKLTREQFDLDYDGRIDIGRTFRDGKLVLDEQDINRDGFVDAWRRYDKGRLLRIETDRDGDGRADMFAYYVAGRVDRIGYDINGDGRVDQWDHDAARRAREAENVRKENEEDLDRGGTSDDYVDEAKDDADPEAAEAGDGGQPKPPTSAPERTGGDSLKPKAGAGEDPAVKTGEAKSLPDDNSGKSGKKSSGKKDGDAKAPAKPASPAKPAKPGAQKPKSGGAAPQSPQKPGPS